MFRKIKDWALDELALVLIGILLFLLGIGGI